MDERERKEKARRFIVREMEHCLGTEGSKLSKERDDAKYAELEVRSLTGHGAH
ncbi:MAG: hypothetical protein ACI4P0_00615 [Mailhella sp.]